MSPCSVCRYQVIDGTADICPNCGAPLKSEPKNTAYEEPETATPDRPAMNIPPADQTVINGRATAQDADDALELCDPGEFLGGASEAETTSPEDRTPIGKTTPPLPPGASLGSNDGPEQASSETSKRNLQKLSSEQISVIRSNLLSTDDYVSPDRAGSIMNNLSKPTPDPDRNAHPETTTDSQEPESSSSPTTPRQKKTAAFQSQGTSPASVISSPSPAVRRVAYFHKNFIQLTGHSYPATGDDLVVGDHHYLLRPKKLKTKYVIGAFCIVLAAMLFVVGKQFISPTLPGTGGIIGVVLDQDGRPYISGAQISLAETGKKATSDAIGFFRFDKVPTGVYMVKYTLPDGSAGTENVSVVSDLISTITLGKNWTQASTVAAPETERTRNVATQEDIVSQNHEEARQTTALTVTPKDEKPLSTKEGAAIKLQANIDDAKVVVNGQVLGMGNLAYKNIKPGIVKINVTRDGYKGWSGVVNLKSGEVYNLAVTLEKVESTSTQHSYTAEDFYQSGQTMLGQGNPQAAANDFTEAINLDPQLADAYQGRARAYQLTGTLAAAEADYIKAGEILSTQKRYETAGDAYARALEVNKKSIPALLALADLSERRGDRNKAFDLYDEALKYDEASFRANFELGKLYFAAGKSKDADKRLHKACEIDPRSPEVYHYLMLNYFARDDFSRVKKTYADFKLNVPPDQVERFKTDPKFDPILRIVGEYDRP